MQYNYFSLSQNKIISMSKQQQVVNCCFSQCISGTSNLLRPVPKQLPFNSTDSQYKSLNRTTSTVSSNRLLAKPKMLSLLKKQTPKLETLRPQTTRDVKGTLNQLKAKCILSESDEDEQKSIQIEQSIIIHDFFKDKPNPLQESKRINIKKNNNLIKPITSRLLK